MLHIPRIKKAIRSQSGITIVELVLVIVILGIILPVFSVLLVNTYRDSTVSDNQMRSSSQLLQAFVYLDSSIRSSSAFLTSVPSPYTDVYGPNNLGSSGVQAWSYKGKSPTNRVLITRSYSTTINSFNSGRMPVFINTPEFDCSAQMSYQPQLTYLNLFFVQDSTLYSRILTDTVTSLCPGNSQQQKQSCPPSVAISARDASCKANDEILATNVSEFSVDYFQITSDGLSTAIDPTYASIDPTILAAADFVNVTITASSKGGKLTNTFTQRMTKVNQ